MATAAAHRLCISESAIHTMQDSFTGCHTRLIDRFVLGWDIQLLYYFAKYIIQYFAAATSVLVTFRRSCMVDILVHRIVAIVSVDVSYIFLFT